MDNTNRILFEKPEIKDLARRFTVVDMHFHTRHSDGKNHVEEVAKRAKKLDIGIAITDHNEIKGAVEINQYDDVLSIPGIEVTSREGTHILVYFYEIGGLEDFYDRDIRPNMGSNVMSSVSLDIEEIIRRAKAFDSVVIFPHPYSALYTGICNPQMTTDHQQRLFGMIDGVETINASNLKKWNLRSAVLGFNLDKSITGGSDGHDIAHMGKVVSFAECGRNRREFLEAVKNKRNKIIGKEIHIFGKVRSNSAKLKTNFKNYPDIMEKNIKYSYSVINLKSKNLKDNVKRRIDKRKSIKRGGTK